MSLALRIIPCLDVDAGRVVKGINFTNLVDAGDPVEMARKYQSEGADELTFLDISASSDGRSTTIEVVKKCAEEIFIPLTVGGGISSVAQVDALLRAGADKVSINTAAISNPDLINEISEKFGNQVLVLSVDARRTNNGDFEVTTHGGRKSSGLDMRSWIEEIEIRGAGEILLNSMDRDGVKSGYDLEMIRVAREHSNLPIIASGGAGSLNHFPDALSAGANALLAASIFHFGEIRIKQVKEELVRSGFPVRLEITP
jgi:cyclase